METSRSFDMHTVDFSEIIKEKKKHETFNVSDEYMGLSFADLFDIQRKNTLPVRGMALNTYGDYNISSMIRTSSILGFEKFYIFGRRKFDRRGLVGANHYIDIVPVHGLTEKYTTEPKICPEKLKKFLNENNISPIVMEIDGEDIRKVDWNNHILNLTKNGKYPTIIVGNEWDGFDNEVMDMLKNYPTSKIIKIPQRGVLRSLNVGHCYAIAAWEITRNFD